MSKEYSQWKRKNFAKQVYHFSMMKPVITAHRKQTINFSVIFLHQSPLFQVPLDGFFSSYLVYSVFLQPSWAINFSINCLKHRVCWCILVNTKNCNMPKPTIKCS